MSSRVRRASRAAIVDDRAAGATAPAMRRASTAVRVRRAGWFAAVAAALLWIHPMVVAVADPRAYGAESGGMDPRSSAAAPRITPVAAGGSWPAVATDPARYAQAAGGRSVAVFRSLGRRQCEGGGETAASLASVLRGAGIAVRVAGCGDTGQAVIALCGATTTEIGIFEVSADDVARAGALGFRPLRELPEVRRTACPR